MYWCSKAACKPLVTDSHLGVWFDLSSDGQHQLVVDAAGEIHVERNHLKNRKHRSSSLRFDLIQDLIESAAFGESVHVSSDLIRFH